ncbi:MAG TPA: decarboxylating 6-phosphogluconate dehydrogenase [bacterium]|nr:decarboxylating 6-phosphogluconate dehydrogenase [bacterium]HPQ67473.1 decarboxylating 6-phosphogluconate dehydrogenase [bacterium]
MKLGFVGLGKMGGKMIERLLRGGHEVVAFDRDPAAAAAAGRLGALVADSPRELVESLRPPRAVWVMVPAGETTRAVIEELAGPLEDGDVLIDGGNSNYGDTIAAADWLADRGITMLDAGTSGGIWGLTEGYCLMVGGPEEAFLRLEPVLRTLAPPDGYALVGPNGAGHFVKMVHNGIEYALLQAYGEGFEIMREKKEFEIDLPAVARLWNRGSVIRSWLLELAAAALGRNPDLSGIKGYVEDSGEGRWTVAEAIRLNVSAPVITLSLLQRMASRRPDPFAAKLIAALRNEFGGHAVKSEE